MSESTPEAQAELAPKTGFRVVQHTLMRPDQELDVRALYVGGVSSFSTGGTMGRQSGSGHDEGGDAGPESTDGGYEADHGMSGFGRVTSAGHTVVEPERRLTFGTYFNAFPASYRAEFAARAPVPRGAK